jgi:hypothetical protein
LQVVLGGNALQLTALSDSVFETPAFSEPITFSTHGATPAMLAEAFGMTAPAPRLAAAPTLTSAQRQEYTGRYVSAELDSWATIRVQGDTLQARMRWGEWMRLEPLTPDTFVAVAARVDLTRDRKGVVSGFTLSQARTRGVLFDRAR